ncbi:hypothetical protein ATANTOWER_032226 [Ataeniobius toweri]|uniref:Ig-like domain-containing protein n=1 Tax=Ataeniobius toweri TaxID=208326 RepID=A0ABU7C4I0_9TELE|nr:hypothetical protein [Ataeniobius toweri]
MFRFGGFLQSRCSQPLATPCNPPLPTRSPWRNWIPPLCLGSEVFVSESYTVGGSGGSGESNNYLIFGSGTKLYVTGDKVKPPEVNLYSVTSEYQQEKKQPLLCVASGMFPPVIRFSWRRQKENGPLEDLAPADGEHVELREAGRISSIWVVHQDPLYKYEYSCSVKHEGQVKEPQTKIVVFPPPPPPPSGPHWFRERLLCLLYSVLISKSLIYFCGLSLFSICGNQRA